MVSFSYLFFLEIYFFDQNLSSDTVCTELFSINWLVEGWPRPTDFLARLFLCQYCLDWCESRSNSEGPQVSLYFFTYFLLVNREKASHFPGGHEKCPPFLKRSNWRLGIFLCLRAFDFKAKGHKLFILFRMSGFFPSRTWLSMSAISERRRRITIQAAVR